MNNRLYRSTDDRVLAGVAGGMAEAYDIDPALVRLGWALLIVFTGGAFLVIYVIMALVVPLRPMGWTPTAGPMPGQTGGPMTDPMTGATPGPTSPDDGTTPMTSTTVPPPGSGATPPWTAPPFHEVRRRDGNAPLVIGLLLVLVGGYLLLRQFFPLFDIGRFWPVIVILIGLALIATAFGRRSR